MSERVENVTLDWDEDGLYLFVVTDEDDYTFIVTDPEELYDTVKGAVGPWLQERDDAKALYDGHRRAGLKWSASGWIPEEEDDGS